MSQKVKESIEVEESKIIEEQNKQKEEKKKKEWIKGIKVPQKTLWEEGIVKSPIVAFEDFKINKDDFNIVKNEEEKEVKTVDQIFDKFVQDEIKDVDNRLIRNMEKWNNRAENEKPMRILKTFLSLITKEKICLFQSWKINLKMKLILNRILLFSNKILY